MRISTFPTAILAIGLSLVTAAAQNGQFGLPDEGVGPVSVRLEAHEGQTKFKMGDPVTLDLVFASRSHKYEVDTNTDPYPPPRDLVHVTPKSGWIRSRTVLSGQGLNGNTLVALGHGLVRVPILLNRSITFLQPGRYAISLSTERLCGERGFTRLTSIGACGSCNKMNSAVVDIFPSAHADACGACSTTNSVIVDISPRDAEEEATLVESLVRELEMTNPDEPGGLPQRKMKEFRSQGEALLRGRSLSSLSEAEKKALLQKLEALEKGYFSDMKARQTERRATAIRLAYLPGDDALRAKVEIIAHSYDEVGEADSIAEIMVDGLPSSNNKRLQLALLEAVWRDPKNIPTEALQTAVREARELANHETVTDPSIMWVGTREHQDAVMKEYQREINELIATLPLRSEPNRAKTIKYIKSRGTPNQLNSRK